MAFSFVLLSSISGKLISAKKGSVIITVRCKTYMALVDLFEKNVSGRLNNLFSPLEAEMKRKTGIENFQLHVYIKTIDIRTCASDVCKLQVKIHEIKVHLVIY